MRKVEKLLSADATLMGRQPIIKSIALEILGNSIS